ncbi:MAG: hypothetical protein HY063_01380 [Bacteroidetes bacterium]|nr:hypothetical protein [Bacteroidota bacterium]
MIWVCNKPAAPNCSDRKRWDVKTLTDADAVKINFSYADTSISALTSIAPQKTVDKNTPRFGIEFRTFRIHCRIREYKLSSDGDYHLVLEDINDPSKTMIGEIPDPNCGAVQTSSHINEINQARKTFETFVEVTSQVKPGTYIIDGVSFYDEVHGQLGVAPNGIEIHPILSIIKQ